MHRIPNLYIRELPYNSNIEFIEPKKIDKKHKDCTTQHTALHSPEANTKQKYRGTKTKNTKLQTDRVWPTKNCRFSKNSISAQIDLRPQNKRFPNGQQTKKIHSHGTKHTVTRNTTKFFITLNSAHAHAHHSCTRKHTNQLTT